MTITYQPVIVTRIPSDIDQSRHAEIERQLEAARKTLCNRDSFSRARAIEMAALAISQSGASACAYPDAGAAAAVSYTLIMLNAQGASEESRHSTKASARRKIRTWGAKGMTARVYTSDGACIYEGSALSF